MDLHEGLPEHYMGEGTEVLGKDLQDEVGGVNVSPSTRAHSPCPRHRQSRVAGGPCREPEGPGAMMKVQSEA